MNVLAIGAHFDDIELGCGGALARHAADGDRVYGYVATTSGYVNHHGAWVRRNRMALCEARKASAILNITLITNKFRALNLTANDRLNCELLTIMEKHRIDTVYTHWNGDAHCDHRVIAATSIHCCRHIPRVLMYRSNWYDTEQAFVGSFYVDVTAYWTAKIAAVDCHSSEMQRTRKSWLAYLDRDSANAGSRIGVERAEAYEVLRWLR